MAKKLSAEDKITMLKDAGNPQGAVVEKIWDFSKSLRTTKDAKIKGYESVLSKETDQEMREILRQRIEILQGESDVDVNDALKKCQEAITGSGKTLVDVLRAGTSKLTNSLLDAAVLAPARKNGNDTPAK